MGRRQKANQWFTSTILLTLFGLECISSATVKGIFTPDSPLTRLPRETSYPNRYSSSSSNDKSIQPEESSETKRDPQNVGKRCTYCDSGFEDKYPSDRYPSDRYPSSRYPSDRYPSDRYPSDRYPSSRYPSSRYPSDRYPSDRYPSSRYPSDRYSSDRYPSSSYPYDRTDRYPSDRYRYEGRYDDRSYDRYDRDRYSDRDRYESYPERSRYSEDDRYSNGYTDRSRGKIDGFYDRSSPYENRDRYDRYERYPERGSGYDNRGYDYREGYRPWDETYRGTSGFDSTGRGYYFASGRPEYGASTNNAYGSYGGGGYASGYNYGSSGSGKDDYNRDSGGYGGGSSSYSNRYNRDPYDGYRTTSYLYGRQSSTTSKPPSDNGSSNTQSPQDNSG